MQKKILQFAQILLSINMYSVRGIAQTVVSINEDSQRIVELRLSSGTTLTEDMVIYANGNSWFLPLGEMSDNLGIAIASFSSIGKAEGTILRQDQTFLLNLSTCEVFLKDIKQTFSCGQVVVYQNDIYVDLALLQSWLPVNFDFNTFSSTLFVTSREKLPIEERLEREQKAKSIQAGNGSYDPGFDPLEVPYSYVEGPFIDQQLAYNYAGSEATTTKDFHHDTAVTGELLGLETSAFVGGNQDELDQTRATFAKKDPKGQLLGPLKARDVEFFDINLPSLPIIGGSGGGKGAMISSFSLSAPTNYSNEDLIGDLPTGWEVELYQNETLIDRKVADKSSRYEFKNLPLIYGLNRFKLIFYGPQGQRREEYKSFNIDQRLQRNGENSYRVGYIKTEKNQKRYLMQYDQNLSSVFTARFGFSQMAPLKKVKEQQYGMTSLVSSLGPLLATASGVTTDYGGNASEIGFQVPFSRITMGVKQIYLNNFYSDLYEYDPYFHPIDATNANLSLGVLNSPALRFTFDAKRTRYNTRAILDELTQRTSLITGPMLWNNELQYVRGYTNSFGGDFAANFQLLKTSTRFNAMYDDTHILSAGIDSQYQISNEYLIRGGIAHTLTTSVTNYLATFNRTFKSFTLAANFNIDSNQVFSIGALLSYNLMRDPVENKWHMNGASQSSLGAASVFAYNDENRDGVYNVGDSPMANVGLQSHQREIPLRTNEEGRALLGQLPPHQALDLAVAPSTLEDPYQQTLVKGYRFYPRAGKTAKVEFAIQTFSDLSGTLSYPGHAKKGIEVQLVDAEKNNIINKTVTGSDGFYQFDRIFAGKYKIQIDSSYLEKHQLVSIPREHELLAPGEGISEASLDFKLNQR